MRNFDEERTKQAETTADARTFVIGGVTLRARAFVAPEAVDALTHEGHESVADMYDAWICELIEKADVPKWKKLRKSADPPLNLQNLEDLVVWLIEVAAGRPTVRPSSSRRGPEPSEATSKAPSSSPARAG